MSWAMLTFWITALILTCAPVCFDDEDRSLRVLRNAGYEVMGRDPCDGTGLCCALLPAIKEADVYHVTLPDSRWNLRHLEYIKKFDNLLQIRSDRPVTLAEYEMLKMLGNEGTLVIVTVVGK